jgi:hypothetical protein
MAPHPVFCLRVILLSAEVLDVNVSTQSGVVGQIPAYVVWIFVNDDVVTIPIPAISKG